jgi:hypothetical protein
MTRAILLFGDKQHRLLIFTGSLIMKTLYLMIGLIIALDLNGCTQHPIIDGNRQNTQPLLTQMLCPMCDVPSLSPLPPAKTPAPQPVDFNQKTITTADNPPPNSETTASAENPPPPVDAAAPPPPVTPAPVSSPSKRVITLDLNAPDLGIH